MNQENADGSLMILDAFTKAESVFSEHKNVVVAISGGADSDVMLDLIQRVTEEKDVSVTYVWFDTGIEYEATKRHLSYLEERYGIEIERRRAVKPIPTCCRTYGQPFVSKYVSEHMERLQRHGFRWEDKPFEELYAEFTGCKSSLRWWTNDFMKDKDKPTRFDIARNKWLKEFILENPPTFAISNKCCTYAKKYVMKNFIRESDFDLNCTGIRRSEGGIRSTVYKTCFDSDNTKYGLDVYRPLFWMDDTDRAIYEEMYDIKHSACYTDYGYKRTGCEGCPYNRRLEEDLRILQLFEPRLHDAVNRIFADSYEYTRMYRAYYDKRQKEAKR